jgi:RNA polymerase sigma-70 factor, ECF subfamily
MELLERFAQGDVAAFETLFRQFQPEIHGWIAKLVRDPAAAEDLTIETFLRIHRARARFDPARSFGAWARRIATHAATDHLERRTRRAEAPLGDPPAPVQGDPALQREIGERTRQALAGLPPRFRVAVTLALIEERPYEEIAEALGTSVGTVKSRVFRGTRLLRKKLERWGIKP